MKTKNLQASLRLHLLLFICLINIISVLRKVEMIDGNGIDVNKVKLNKWGHTRKTTVDLLSL